MLNTVREKPIVQPMPHAAPNPSAEPVPIRHQVGLIAQWPIGSDLQKHAKIIGAQIRYDGNDQQYHVEFPNGNPAFNKAGSLFEAQEYLKFLHQPLLQGLRTDENGNKTNNRKDARAGREILHRALRYGLTGQPDIPAYRHVSLDAQGAECHEETIGNMEKDQMLSKTSDIDITGKANRYDPNKDKEPLETALLPGSRFDAQKGFSFSLNERLLRPASPTEEKFANWFWDTLKESTGIEKQNFGLLYLAPDQLHAFIRTANKDITNETLADLSQQLSDEDYQNDLIKQIEEGHQHLCDNPTLQKLLETQLSPFSADEKLQQLLEANTALSAIALHPQVDKHWRFYHWTKRNDSPYADFTDQVNRLNKVIEHYQTQGKLDEAKLSAISMHPEFYQIFAFGRDMTQMVKGDLERIKPHKRTAQQNADIALAGRLKEIFTRAAPIDVKIAEQHRDEELSEMIEVLEMATEQGQGAMARTGKKAVEDLLDFWNDVFFVGPKEAPLPTLALFLGVYMYYKGIPFMPDDPQVTAPINDPTTIGLDAVGSNTQFDFSSLGAENIAENTNDGLGELSNIQRTPEEEKTGIEGIDYHWHYGAFGAYKHWFVASIENTVRTLSAFSDTALGKAVEALGLEPVNDPAYMTGATNAAQDVGKGSFILNLFQNGPGHFLMYTRLILQNAKYGPAGFARFLEFFHDSFDSLLATARQRPGAVGLGAIGLGFDTIEPMQQILQESLGATDLKTGLVCAMVGTLVGGKLIHLRRTKPGELGQAIMANIRDNKLVPSIEASLDEQIHSLSEAALQIEEIKFELKKGTLKGSYNLDASHAHEMCHILDQMHLSLATIAEDVGGDGVVYQSLLQGKIESLSTAIHDYSDNKIPLSQLEDVFQHTLEDLIYAQIHLTGESSIYKAITGEDMDKKQAYQANLRGKFTHSTANRQEANDNNQAEFNNHMNKAQTVAGTRLYSSILGGIDLLKQDGRNLIDLGHKAYTKTALGLSNIKHKKAVAATVATAATSLFLMDKAGYSGNGADALQTASMGLSYAGSAVAGTLTFLGINFVDDQIVVHGGLGATAAGVGLTAWLAHNGALSPVGRYSAELTQSIKEKFTKKKRPSNPNHEAHTTLDM